MAKKYDMRRYYCIQAQKRKKSMGTETQAAAALDEIIEKERENVVLTPQEKIDKAYAMNRLFAGSKSTWQESVVAQLAEREQSEPTELD
ncbi:MAG: hypothetical protein R3Y32_06740 [Bacillota bacterium]